MLVKLFAKNINPQLVRVLRTIGFDKTYVRGDGAWLFDAEGSKYLDMLSGYGVFNVGRNNYTMREMLHALIDLETANMVQMDAPLLAGVLAEKLLEKVGGSTDKVFFTNSGTEANEGAIKFARKATGKKRILFLEHAFHGLSTGSLALNGNKEFTNGFGELLPGTCAIKLGDNEALRYELLKGDVAAFILEPIQGKGVNLATKQYYLEAQALCQQHGALLIIDEVQTGMGRTGKWFAHQHWGLQPDIVTVSKALSGGFIPIGAICYNQNIYKKVFRSMEECVVHSNTFGRNIMACAAGLAAIDIIENEKLIENAIKMGGVLKKEISAMIPRFEMLREVRGQGLMLAIDFAEPQSLKLRAGWKLVHAVNRGLFGQMVVVPLMRQYRIITQVAGHNLDVIKLLPSLCLNEVQVDYFLQSFEKVMIDCHKFPGNAWTVGKDLALAAARSRKNTTTQAKNL